MVLLLIPLVVGALYFAFRGNSGAPALAMASGAAVASLSALLARAAQALAPIATNTAVGVISWRTGEPPTATAILATLKWVLVFSEGGISLYQGGPDGAALPSGPALVTLPALVLGSPGPALALVGTAPARFEALGSGRWVVLDRPPVRPIIKVSRDQMPARPQAAPQPAQPAQNGISQGITAQSGPRPLVLEQPIVAQGAGHGIVAAAQAAANAALDMAHGGKPKTPPAQPRPVNTDATGRLDSVTGPSVAQPAQGPAVSQAVDEAKAWAANFGSMFNTGGTSGELLPEDAEAQTRANEGNE